MAASLSSTARTAWSALAGALVIHGLSVLVGEQWSADLTAEAIGVLVYLGVLETVVAYVLFSSLFERHSAIEVTLVTYLVPVVAASAGWAPFGERLTWRMSGGFLVVVLGFALMKRRELRAELVRIETGE